MATWGTPISLKGVKGDAGLSVLTTYGPPASTDGFDGQSAITDTGDLYFRNNGTWSKVRSLVGQSGMNGLNAQLLHGAAAPDENTFANNADAIYLQDGGEVWFFDFEGAKKWVDAGYSLRGLQGVPGQDGVAGKDGLRGSQRYVRNGPPPSDSSTIMPAPAVGDEWVDIQTAGGPYIYYFQ